MRRRKPAPWHLVYRKIDHLGRRSQPVVHNSRGKRVGNHAPDAALMAASAEPCG
jgi:hypothetical protein